MPAPPHCFVKLHSCHLCCTPLGADGLAEGAGERSKIPAERAEAEKAMEGMTAAERAEAEKAMEGVTAAQRAEAGRAMEEMTAVERMEGEVTVAAKVVACEEAGRAQEHEGRSRKPQGNCKCDV